MLNPVIVDEQPHSREEGAVDPDQFIVIFIFI
jgi:hypothetical protein